MQSQDLFRLGINYWPISSAMYWWQKFDLDEVSHDFQQLKQSRFDSIRIFLLWEDFQPDPRRVSDQSIHKLISVIDEAEKIGLSVIVTLFTGHMSGVNWIPKWALGADQADYRFRVVSQGTVSTASLRNWFEEKEVRDAQKLLAGEVAGTLHGKSGVWAYDLGNENSNCVIPESRDSGLRWLDAVTSAIRAKDSKPITVGLHMEDLEEDRRIGPAEAGQFCEFLSMHGYPMYAKWARNNTDELLLPFLGLVTKWLGQREVLFQEFGAPTISGQDKGAAESWAGGVALLSEAEAAEYTRRSLEGLHRSGMTGAMLWCFADYAESLRSRPPLDASAHERSFGLWRQDHSPKPAVREVIEFGSRSRIQVTDDFSWIYIDREEFYQSPLKNLKKLYKQWLLRS